MNDGSINSEPPKIDINNIGDQKHIDHNYIKKLYSKNVTFEYKPVRQPELDFGKPVPKYSENNFE